MEELDNLEETLNESIRESLGARAGKTTCGKRQGATEDDEEDYMRYLATGCIFKQITRKRNSILYMANSSQIN